MPDREPRRPQGAWTTSLDAETVRSRLAGAGCIAASDEAADLVRLAPDDATLDEWVRRREHGEPLAWIVGSVEFGGTRVAVDPGVFVPRAQTVPLAKRAERRVPPRGMVADLCTGSGAVGRWLSSRRTDVTVVGSDVDPSAVACASRNGVLAVLGDLDAAFASGSVDVVTAVAPYVPSEELSFLPRDVQAFEPRRALDGGPRDGLALLRRVVTGAARLLRPAGWLLVEVGGDQDELLRPHLEHHGFDSLVAWADEEGDLRGMEARLGRS